MRRALAVVAILGISGTGLSGCAIFEDVISFDDEQTAAASAADQQNLLELSIATGRYGVMLGQAREILRLPEPKASTGDMIGAAASDSAAERAQLAQAQVKVTSEFIADTARACQKRKLPKGVRSLACEQQKKVPAELHTPVAPEITALSGRNDKVGSFIIEWWDAVCATAPKPRQGEPSACSIE